MKTKLAILLLLSASFLFAWPTQPLYLSDVEVIQTVTCRPMTITEIMDVLNHAPNVKAVSYSISPPNFTRPFRVYLDTLAYPQYEDDYSLSVKEWGELQAYCVEKLAQDSQGTNPEVLAHWRSIAGGTPPFGLRVSKTKQ